MYVCVVNNSAGEQILESTLTVTGKLGMKLFIKATKGVRSRKNCYKTIIIDNNK